jgi:hypothetical protein
MLPTGCQHGGRGRRCAVKEVEGAARQPEPETMPAAGRDGPGGRCRCPDEEVEGTAGVTERQ